jgi:hypothetical protein
MPEPISPRQILRDLLQGTLSARPLFVPITFAMASRIENLPLPSFLTNPTKISNALRQTRAPLRSDAVSCYFDPMLEADALGAKGVPPGELPDGLASPEDAVKRGRVPIALDVIRRIKALLRDESLLMAGVSGPLTLASRLAGLSTPTVARANLPDAALELAITTITEIAKAFAEAGASLIFLQEHVTPGPDAASAEEWLSSLTPALNIIRFYEVLPVLQIAAGASAHADPPLTELLANAWPECVVSLPIGTLRALSAAARANIPHARLGVSLPLDAVETKLINAADFDQMLSETIREFRPAIVTTASDLLIATDPKRVAALAEIVRHSN